MFVLGLVIGLYTHVCQTPVSLYFAGASVGKSYKILASPAHRGVCVCMHVLGAPLPGAECMCAVT